MKTVNICGKVGCIEVRGKTNAELMGAAFAAALVIIAADYLMRQK